MVNTQSGEMGIQAPTEQETQLALQKLNSNKAVGRKSYQQNSSTEEKK
jgi:hypothetical protein